MGLQSAPILAPTGSAYTPDSVEENNAKPEAV